ncbi:Indole-3-pyruvate decarboxylase [Serratia fonticola]|uniref:Indole-3-pyruvate decarboxylase n=1 Tax=Serratia fonticola TaxID=47917 RepID=A0A4U9UNG0_SERFO|nr:Indole-3-pyruvate decarboxylase [Serratia fonticola]
MRITIGSFILQQLRALKVDRIYGVPGDYNLALLETIEHDQECEFIGNCNELNAAYAADGYARLKGAGALITTYGVGDLAALSGIAGAYAESAPVICIAGTPPLHAMQGNALLHHSLADGNFDNVMNCFRQFTVAQALITPENAATEIPRVIACAWQRKKPVYLQLPSDICEVEIEVADNPAPYRLPSSDASHLQLASAALLERINRAKRPIILIDQMVERYQLQTQVLALADKFAIPLTNMPTAKCAISENTPGWQSGYNGDLSRPELFELMAQSDCILSFGVRLVDSTTGYFSQQIPEQSVVDIQPFFAEAG